MNNVHSNAVLRLIGGPADGFVFTIPAETVPPLVGVGPARYVREPGNGHVICYRFSLDALSFAHTEW